MADIHYWIQLENHWWDSVPHRFDRMMGTDFNSGPAVGIKHNVSPETGHIRNVKMYQPMTGEALIFRRYTENWAAPADQKVNPWDINEPNPTDNGTMGTIPGPVIECNIGDRVLVHFRNKDFRSSETNPKARAHSMHTHGFVFLPFSDGAYPLTPPDPSQDIPVSERGAWDSVGVTGPKKMGDRVPPGGTFLYTWETKSWPSTAGVWLYHDHSFCDVKNMGLGAIGLVVIHNLSDPNDVLVDTADLPNGNVNGSITVNPCTKLTTAVAINPAMVDQIRNARMLDPDIMLADMTGMRMEKDMPPGEKDIQDKTLPTKIELEHFINLGDAKLQVSRDFTSITHFCISTYRQPPVKAQYLMLFHELEGVGFCINGRQYLGNCPTMIAGTNTKMRFGVIGMGNMFHTFHIHGHRWVIPGPEGNTPGAIQGSAERVPVSQFEDTRIFGPANSFSFTIEGASGSFMRAGGSGSNDSKGEWHMHCHVLGHMTTGMMGSLLIVNAGDFAGGLQKGEADPCDPGSGMPGMGDLVITARNDPSNTAGFGYSFDQSALGPVHAGNTIRFNNPSDAPHSIIWDVVPNRPLDSAVFTTGGHVDILIPNAGIFHYTCGIHGNGMAGTITVLP